MGALDKAASYARLYGLTEVEAAYKLLGLGSLNMYEVEEVEAAHPDQVPEWKTKAAASK